MFMKKYIKPVQRVFNVSTCEIIANSLEYTGGNGDSNYDGDKGIDVKEEKGAGIWDLY